MLFIPSARSTVRSPLLSLAVLASLGALTGCYTQLATRGYGAVQVPAYGTPADSSTGDSALAERPAGSRSAPPVIVNHYYHPGLAYRGYAHWEWDYPALTLGYYSSRYSHYSRPYWWDDPYSSRRPAYWHDHHPHSHRDGDSRPAPGGGGSAAPRLFNPDTDYPRPGKIRRSEPAPISAPPPSPSPAPKQGEDSGSSSSSSSDQDRDYPRLKKGKRR